MFLSIEDLLTTLNAMDVGQMESGIPVTLFACDGNPEPIIKSRIPEKAFEVTVVDKTFVTATRKS